MNTKIAPSRKLFWFRSIGCLLLVPLTCYLQYLWGSSQGYEGAALAGYSTRAMLLVLVVIGMTALFKKARNLRSLLLAACITLLFHNFISIYILSWLRAEAGLAALSVTVDPASYAVDAQQAELLGQQIQAWVQQGKTKEVTQLMNPQRLMRKGLAGQTVTLRLREYAKGYARGLPASSVFEQFTPQGQPDGTFQFVKYLRKNDRPLLQFRWVSSLGELRYVGIYLYKDDTGKLGIEDLLFYETGESLAEQMVTLAQSLGETPPPVNKKREKEILLELQQLLQQRKFTEALHLIEALPPTAHRIKSVQQVKVQLMYEVDPAKADILFTAYRKAYPQDLSVVFLRFNAHLVKNECRLANRLVEEVYQAVDRDDYFLWHTAQVFAATPHQPETLTLLTNMETQYQINVRQMAPHYLPARFLSSREYQRWASRPPARKKVEPIKKTAA